MVFSVNEFQGGLPLGGARSTLFQVDITNPVNPTADRRVPLLCRAAQLPGLTLGIIPVPFQGRQIKLPGNRTYAEWTTTFMNDEDFAVRNEVEEWNHAINSAEGNIRKFATSSPIEYKSVAAVTQFGKDNRPVRVYNFVGIWPVDVQTIDLNWEGEGIQEWTCTWAYDYFTISGGNTGDGGSTG